jgi:acyl-CoA synthetase (AMP-forming)/AMP-acid ligase II
MTHSGEDYAERPTSCGAPLPVIDLQIKSVDGAQVLAVGEIGELWVRGPNVVRGYWQRASETAETFVDGWLRTGDLARLDPEGFCYVVDRIKDVVIRGGENIYCVEVENALYEHPAVLDAAVIGRSHRTLGEEPVGVVHIAAGHCVTEAQLRAHLGRRLAAFKIPVQIVFWPTMLPRNANGKILKRELKSALP